MSRCRVTTPQIATRFPRVSGDEPHEARLRDRPHVFSPRERG